jgi:hypothetical protein
MRYHEILTYASLHEVADLEQQRIKAQQQAAKRQTAAAKRADLTHRIQKLQSSYPTSTQSRSDQRPANCRSNRRLKQKQALFARNRTGLRHQRTAFFEVFLCTRYTSYQGLSELLRQFARRRVVVPTQHLNVGMSGHGCKLDHVGQLFSKTRRCHVP